MRGERLRRGHTGAPAALLLLAVFAVSLLLTLLAGGGAYRRLAQRDAAAFEARTAVQYLTTRVRQGDVAGGVAVEDFGGVPALVFPEEGGYHTRIYCWEGALRELYSLDELSLAPEDGEAVLDLAGLDLTLADGLLTARLTLPGGGVRTVALALRSGEVGP